MYGLGHGGNRGLNAAFAFAKELRSTLAPEASLADIIAFIGKCSIERGLSNGGRIVVIDYRDGRIDCDHPESTDNDILLPHGRIANTSKFLCEIFPTMTTRESVALMGMTSAFQAARNLALESTAGPSLADMIAFIGKSALENACSKAGCQSLGQLHPEISGFSGQWDRVPVDIDNGYFRNML